uniref:Ig-like domain-containing protein n=1 Tax=Pseudonaja textilis TaxID=8673 RepID=A0A670YWG1_PSETE
EGRDSTGRDSLPTRLKDEKVDEGSTVKFHCEVTVPKAPAEWRKDGAKIHAGPKYDIRQDGGIHDLLIHNLEAQDSGKYSCIVGDQTTSATLSVQGMSFLKQTGTHHHLEYSLNFVDFLQTFHDPTRYHYQCYRSRKGSVQRGGGRL